MPIPEPRVFSATFSEHYDRDGIETACQVLGQTQSHFGNVVMTLLYMPIGRDDMFHVEQFALYAHFLQKIEEMPAFLSGGDG
jgi:hypothetical protein